MIMLTLHGCNVETCDSSPRDDALTERADVPGSPRHIDHASIIFAAFGVSLLLFLPPRDRSSLHSVEKHSRRFWLVLARIRETRDATYNIRPGPGATRSAISPVSRQSRSESLQIAETVDARRRASRDRAASERHVYRGVRFSTTARFRLTPLKGLEEMKVRRFELQAQIESQEEEKNNLQREIEKMSCKLTQLNDSLTKRITIRNEYDRTIADTEAAYVKILESSQLLLNMIKKEAVSLDQTLGKANPDKQYR
ncbi:SSNA1 protein, partial [Acromyrmex heyeri]